MLRVPGYADHLNVVIEAKELETFADRVLVGPESARGGFVDDGDLGAVFAIGAIELPAAHDGYAECFEVVGRNVVRLRQNAVARGSALLSFRKDAA